MGAILLGAQRIKVSSAINYFQQKPSSTQQKLTSNLRRY